MPTFFKGLETISNFLGNKKFLIGDKVSDGVEFNLHMTRTAWVEGDSERCRHLLIYLPLSRVLQKSHQGYWRFISTEKFLVRETTIYAVLQLMRFSTYTNTV